MPAVSIPGPLGLPKSPYGSFAGKTGAPVPVLTYTDTELVTDGLRRPTLQLWDDAEAAGGSLVYRVPHTHVLAGSEVEDSLAGDGRLTLVVPAEDDWVGSVDVGHVLRLFDPVQAVDNGETFTPTGVEEFRIRDIDRLDGPGRPVARITAWPIITDLTDCGFVFEDVADGRNYDLGELTKTGQAWWDDVISPALTALGRTWWSSGSLPTTEPGVTIDASRITPYGILKAIADDSRVRLQVRTRWNGSTDIKVDVLAQGFLAGVASTNRRLNVGVDNTRVLRMERKDLGSQSATIAVPVREVPTGDTVTAGLHQLVYKVTNVSGSDVTLTDPENNESPFRFADQLGGASSVVANHYLRKVDGTLTEITDTSVAGADVVTVADATGISTDDLVELARNSSGDPVTDVYAPAEIAAHGPLAMPVAVQGFFGRNYVLNPLFGDWPNTDYPAAYACRVASTYTAGTSTIDLKELPASTTIKDRSRLVLIKTGDGWATTVDGDTATSGSGTVTLTLDSALRNSGDAAADTRAILFQEPDEDLADNWSPFQGTTIDPSGAFTPIYAKRDVTEAVTDVSGAVNTTVTLAGPNGTGSKTEIVLKNLSPAGLVFQPGDLIIHDSGSDGLVVMGRAVASGGVATVPVWPLTSQTWTADDAVTVRRPDFAASHYGDDSVVFWRERTGVSSSTGNHGLISTPVFVPLRSGWALRAAAKWGVYNNTESDITVTPAAGVQAFTVAIHDDGAGLGTELSVAEDTEQTYTSRTLTTRTITTDHTLSSGDNLRIRVEPIHIAGTSSVFDAGLTMCLLEVSLSYAPVAHTQDGVEFSGANVAYLAAASALDSAVDVKRVNVDIRDVAYDARFDAGRNKIELGAPWFLNSDALGLSSRPGALGNGVARVTRYTRNLFDPLRSSVVLDQDVFYLSRS